MTLSMRVQHRDVGAVLELHHVGGMPLERLAARIHHDQLGAALGRLLEIGRRHRMVLGRVGADDDNDIGILHLVEGGRHRSRADAFQQRRHRGGVAEPRAMIDIVGAEAGAHQLLEQIGLFVRAFGRAEAGQRVAEPSRSRMVFRPDGGTVERLVPGGGTEMRPRIRRIDDFVRHLRHAILADHRLRSGAACCAHSRSRSGL